MKTNHMTLEQRILDRIKTERVRPTPKGYFKARDYVLWGLLGLSFAALSVGFGMIIYMVRTTDRSLFAKLGFSFSERLLYSIPVFWIIATLGIAGVAYFNLRRTKKGYRVTPRQFVIAAALVAAGLGSLVYASNLSQYVDQAAAANIPIYSTVQPFNTNRWFDPQHGLLSGYVKVKSSDSSFTLRDENFDLWTVTGESVSKLPADFQFQSGDHIKIIGKKTGDLTFQAIEIRQFETPLSRHATSTPSR